MKCISGVPVCILLGIPVILAEEAVENLISDEIQIDQATVKDGKDETLLTLDKNRTMLCALAELGASFEDMSRSMVLRLAFCYRRRKFHRALICLLTENLANRQKYRTASELYLNNASYFAESWVRLGQNPIEVRSGSSIK